MFHIVKFHTISYDYEGSLKKVRTHIKLIYTLNATS